MKIVTAGQMRAIEQEAESRGITSDRLMDTAGLKVAEAARDMLSGKPKGEHVTVLVGSGNNGGDGLVAARHLNEWGARVHVVLCAPRKPGDPRIEVLRDLAVDIVELTDETGTSPAAKALAASTLAIDAVLGTGHQAKRSIGGTIRSGLELLQGTKKRRPEFRVLALDLPSGLDADTGACDAATPSADVTVTLGFPKVGLFIFPGASRVGRLEIADIGIPAALGHGVELELSSQDWVRSILPARPLHANKASFGRVMVVAGSARYIGAAYLACAGAVRAGAGLVTLAIPKSLAPGIASSLPEVTYLPLDEAEWGVARGVESARLIHQEMPAYNTLLVGCGLGQAAQTSEMVHRLLLELPGTLAPRVVIDADGLNIVSHIENWWRHIQAETVLTPHPGELRRLTDLTVEDIQHNRLNAAREASAEWRKTVLLKGAYSIVAAADGKARINPFANPGLATAGTGDVLAGIVAGLLAQGLSTFHAAAAAAYIHGAAGEALRAELGDAGIAASDLLPAVPRVIKRLRGG